MEKALERIKLPLGMVWHKYASGPKNMGELRDAAGNFAGELTGQAATALLASQAEIERLRRRSEKLMELIGFIQERIMVREIENPLLNILGYKHLLSVYIANRLSDIFKESK